MTKEQRISSHTVTWLTVHIVWVTKYRYKVLTGDIQIRCRELVKQICNAEDVRIPKGVVGGKFGRVDHMIPWQIGSSPPLVVNSLKGFISS